VVLVGDVGTGKSTVVEKLTNERGRASDNDTSVTKSSEVFWTTDGSIVISDTPGSNAMEDKLEHNVWIASALNFRPVSKIFIMAKAETRLDNVVDNVRKYTDRFVELDPNALGILITHMDKVTWTPTRCSAMINNELGIESVVFSQMNTSPHSLIQDIHGVCRGTYELGVDGDNFLKLFKLNNSNSKILMITAKEVEAFRDLKDIFNAQINAFNDKDRVDLVFEFQAYMEQQIVVAQQSMSQKANFTFMGDNSANEAGHVANMTNQLRAILHSIRIQALGYHSDHGVNDLRQCPHCGLKWAKVEGCEGNTTCGNRPAGGNDLRDPAYAEMATFTFHWVKGGKAKKGQLQIQKSGSKAVQAPRPRSGSGPGCGKTINWSTMKQVPLPEEFMQGAITTNDINDLPNIPAASDFKRDVGNKIRSYTGQMRLGQRPT